MRDDGYTCACCGYRTIGDSPGSYEICDICFWEDDPVQLLDPWYPGGANKPTLVEAQQNYGELGACEERALPHVRKATENDARDPRWRPVAESDRGFVTTPAKLNREQPEGNWKWYYWER